MIGLGSAVPARSRAGPAHVDHQHAVYTALAPNRFKDFWRD